MSGYRQGRDVEYEVIHELADNGYDTIRGASSKGLAESRPLSERVAERYRVDPESGCWIWTAAMYANGYGRFSDGSKRRTRMAHRVSYEVHVGPIPDGLVIDHLCRNRRCVNPQHLEPVTQSVNLQRGQRDYITERREPALSRPCPNGHDRASHAFIDSQGKLACRQCRREASLRSYHRRKAAS